MPTGPHPNALDLDAIFRSVRAALDIPDWELVENIYLVGSIADPTQDIDRDGEPRSDIDIVLVQTEQFDLADEPIYNGSNPADIPLTTTDDEAWGNRTMDLFSGFTPPYDPDERDDAHIELYPR